MKLLVVEDEVKTANILQKGLKEKGYEVQIAYDGEQALKLTNSQIFDLIITDIIIPKISGLEFCQKLRESRNFTPVIMLTALGLTSDKIKGFDAGSDDYLVKPFDFDELLARIKVSMNRTRNISGANKELVYSNVKLDLDSKEVRRDDKLIVLTAKEYALLEFFMRNKHRVVSKEEISEKVWDLNFDTGTNIIEVYVSYLRNKIDKDFPVKLIHTKKGIGYIFREEP
ncbi:response regulator transcription factor [Aurantibacillus circumpalustris]|uniref:response regulator transcription factor n=1 Tax=Aurantibacillus circumpalustris TaxID=3036359 RepID=UPI00295BF25E|nr:response regulator transcription factor [Aurantibacillus circumpalustris]